MFLDVSVLFYGITFGGDHDFNSLELDYRGYKRLGSKRHILAWQWYFRGTTDGAPWTNLTQLGKLTDLRGYRYGRFRDRVGAFIIVEYRHMFDRRRPNKKGSLESRSGFVTWIGSGAVAPTDDLSRSSGLPNAGLGYRFEVEPRMNVRIDYGFGVGSSALYITFNEAF